MGAFINYVVMRGRVGEKFPDFDYIPLYESVYVGGRGGQKIPNLWLRSLWMAPKEKSGVQVLNLMNFPLSPTGWNVPNFTVSSPRPQKPNEFRPLRPLGSMETQTRRRKWRRNRNQGNFPQVIFIAEKWALVWLFQTFKQVLPRVPRRRIGTVDWQPERGWGSGQR